MVWFIARPDREQTYNNNEKQQEKTYFQAKRQAVIQTEYLTDKIIMKVRRHTYYLHLLTIMIVRMRRGLACFFRDVLIEILHAIWPLTCRWEKSQSDKRKREIRKKGAIILENRDVRACVFFGLAKRFDHFWEKKENEKKE